MKRLCKATALILCTVMLLSTLTVAGDSGGETILTLEKAKAIALKNNTEYKVQDSYIGQKKDTYNNMSERSTSGKGSNVAEKAESRINNLVALENAYNAYELEVFNKRDIRRKSDYAVAKAYYDVMTSKYALDNAKRAMELANKDFEIGKVQLEFGMITENILLQLENLYKTTQTKYNSAVSELENSFAKLSKEIGEELDVNNTEIDMTISVPDTSSLDLAKLREDNLNNNPNFFNTKDMLDLAKYKKNMVESEYEDYNEGRHKRNDKISEAYDDMRYEATRDYDNALFQYDNILKELDIALKTQLAGISATNESIGNLRKSVDNARTTFLQNKLKLDLEIVSKIEFEKSESALRDLENQLQTTIINLNSQYLNLTQYSYTTEK